ncbi:putative HNHc nuclease [Liquorilactobacillus satsumensis]|uniref:putative HNHc nuclease n=1 Tax=Liquorilactobacillus TaxID=2767888 RepID=UPI0021C495CE|nr:putative HNHc nuclease [Liquorilactobacillus satsumensis]MCP9313835.1 hypothetical protein [Liquorilactobacillus satsumensis]MCP9360976.1 hypothetical protein [Liquorilactobacillus satsumensis]
MWLPAQVRKISGHDLVIRLDEKPNVERLKTMYSGDLSKVYAKVDLVDPRKARPKQRALFFALLNDIWDWTGYPQSDMKSYFYNEYQRKTYGLSISLKDESDTTVSEANLLINIVLEFMFDWNVPFKQGYELLPKEESYYMYLCCKYRKCAICGKHADIHHVETIGMGGNRTHVDHTKRHVMALCRQHHREIEQIGSKEFSSKYHVPVNGILLDEETLRKIGIRGNYEEETK